MEDERERRNDRQEARSAARDARERVQEEEITEEIPDTGEEPVVAIQGPSEERQEPAEGGTLSPFRFVGAVGEFFQRRAGSHNVDNQGTGTLVVERVDTQTPVIVDPGENEPGEDVQHETEIEGDIPDGIETGGNIPEETSGVIGGKIPVIGSEV